MLLELPTIQLEKTELFQIVDLKSCGAGIIPFDSKNQKLLMGLQSSDKNQFLWSDFGGKTEFGENTWKTACRENKEESLNLQNLQKNMKDIVKIYRIIHYIKFRRKRIVYLKLYTIYILDGFNYDNTVVKEFEKKRSESKHYINKEKLTVCWMDIYSISNYKVLGFRCRDVIHLIINAIF